MTRKFSADEIKMLAAAERQMDAGEVQFVVWTGERMIVDPLVMEELGLQSGQTVSNKIAGAILNAHYAVCQANVALAKLPQ